MKEVFGIGINIPSDEDDHISIASLTSLSECDLAVFEFAMPDDYFAGSSYMGKTCYSQSSSTLIQEHAEHWKKEITSYLNSGKTLFIVLSEKKDFYVHTGKNEYSGTGRNRQTTNLIAPFNNYKFLPNVGLELGVAHGKKIIANSEFSGFLKDFGHIITYQTYINTQSEFEARFTTKNKDKILGGILNILGGTIVFLPKISFSEDIMFNANGSYTKSAKLLGLKFKQFIVSVDKSLKFVNEKSIKPEWTNNDFFTLEKSKRLEDQITSANSKLVEIQEEIQVLNSKLKESERLKDLLFETGKPLEEAVIYALRLLDFSAENFDDGILELDQVIVSPEGVRYIGECEGKDHKSIDITKFRQLCDALNEDFERDEVEEKAYGILFGNPFRNTPPIERSEPFTTKCLAGAAREKIVLFPTYELYKLAKYILENDDAEFKKKCRDSIFNSLGKIVSIKV